MPLTPEQATEIKSRLKEMDSDSGALGRIEGASGELGFTKIGLSPDELKLFDFLNFDTKQICNVLGWSDVLLNNDARGDYGGTIQEIKKLVITDTILPDLDLFDNAVNSEILPRYKKYRGYIIEHDVTELPEMQNDIAKMSEWLGKALDRGVINRNEYRLAIKYSALEDDNMDTYTVASDIMTLDQAINDFPLNPPNEETI